VPFPLWKSKVSWTCSALIGIFKVHKFYQIHHSTNWHHDQLIICILYQWSLINCRYIYDHSLVIWVSRSNFVPLIYVLPASVMSCILWNGADEVLISCYMYCPCCLVPNWQHIYRNHIYSHLGFNWNIAHVLFCFGNWLFVVNYKSFRLFLRWGCHEWFVCWIQSFWCVLDFELSPVFQLLISMSTFFCLLNIVNLI
jgi:hypothetical protein